LDLQQQQNTFEKSKIVFETSKREELQQQELMAVSI
jgi:hypothetical protein